MELTLSIVANERIIQALRAIPLADMATFEAVKALIERFILSDEEKEAADWKAVDETRGMFRYNVGSMATRTLDENEARLLLFWAEHPPRGLEWSFAQMEIRNEIVTALGGKAWE